MAQVKEKAGNGSTHVAVKVRRNEEQTVANFPKLHPSITGVL